MTDDRLEDTQRARVREFLETLRSRSRHAQSWHEQGRFYSALLNNRGYVPITTRLTGEDLAFLTSAREDMIAFTELGLRLVELHQPRDAGGISSDPTSPIQRCRGCMWRWPCPTFRAFTELLGAG